MNLADRLTALANETPICKVQEIIGHLDDHTAEVLQRVLRSKVSNRAIAEELTKEGHQVGRTSIGLHRSGRCSCRRIDESR